jgi:hypothetical protein
MDVFGELAILHRLAPNLLRELVTHHLLELAGVPRDRRAQLGEPLGEPWALDPLRAIAHVHCRRRRCSIVLDGASDKTSGEGPDRQRDDDRDYEPSTEHPSRRRW